MIERCQNTQCIAGQSTHDVHHRKCLQWAHHEQQNWTMEQCCLVRCGWAHHLLGEEMQQDAPCEETVLSNAHLGNPGNWHPCGRYFDTFTFMHLADAFIQSDLQCIQAIHFLSVHVFPGNRTHNLCAANTMLYH